MKVLNLYAGVGGNRKLWTDVHVTAVELDPKIADVYKKLYPGDTVIIGDAHQYLLDHHAEFDFIWSSPPCQTHSKMMKATRHDVTRYPDMSLYQQIILLTEFFKGKWVVENVIPHYKPLIPGTKIGRHIFWTNFWLDDYRAQGPNNFIKESSLAGKKKLMDWLGIHFEEVIYYGDNHCPCQILRNCVHPKLGKHIMDCATRGPGTGLLFGDDAQ